MLDVLPELLTRHRLARPIALVVNLALLALLVSLLARASWFVLSLRVPPPAVMPAVTAPNAASSAATESLARWHLFGNALPLSDPRAMAQNAPETGLKLSLRGVFAGADARQGHAIIAEEQGPDRTYRVGDELPGGARLDAVYADRVTLLRGVALESLLLPRAGSEAPAASRGGSAAVLPGPGAKLPGATAANAPFVNPMIATNPVTWNQATQKLDMDPAALAREVQVLPVLENGKFVGVRLSGGKDTALLAKLGLQPDDVVTAVNGINLDNPARGAEVAASLKNSQSATVTVRRNGKPTTLSVSLH